ncbi:MAG: butyrate kinase, partial [Clostridium sp.]|nr:butyrate kinase [Clostridium sp.]
MRVLAINPGSTSTKIAVYEDERPLLVKSISHSAEDLKPFVKVSDQYPFRLGLIRQALEEAGFSMEFDAVIGRGSLAKPVEGGVYVVDQRMVDEALAAEHQHACDLGCVIAYDIASKIEGCKCFTADPGVTDELCDEARISGSPHCERICIWHALNQRATARKFAAGIGRKYEDLDLIVCHLGGGISVAAHRHGRAIDANNALDGEGPFSPERAGSL